MTISWYSIIISLQSGEGVIFNGYFSVDNTSNLVTAFYETINGSTNFNNNILIPTGTGIPVETYLGFTVYDSGLTPSIYYDNAYLPTWFQFDNNGVIINSMSAYPQYNTFNLWADGYGNEIINNIGIVGNNQLLSSLFTITPTSNPISNTCFPVGTPISCNQGNIPIEQINSDIHTIRKKKIVGITKTITQEKYLVCFEKDALGNNIPSQKTIISKNHSIFYQGNMIQAKQFVGMNDKVYKIKYRKEILYNVLMKEHDKIIVNNLICETLHPENGIAQLYRALQKLNPQEQNDLINNYNEYVIKNKTFTSKK
jgi:hypothetical protein